ncbi:FHA domain-containing protein [Homoserinibacter sp. YIM 151385]|uniref:FHA domain-containing protein n=1 Tax=Homoserinibacter sp. YIM 151385 TaxID=2985506 RepID=UPI0022F07F3F|nr:FHA domain-containing protein [Homoserinibacter sp. YIM 151385]WBU38305.1 FHA domain-containing protein [Homoserinibacter sp. YIM 151385]
MDPELDDTVLRPRAAAAVPVEPDADAIEDETVPRARHRAPSVPEPPESAASGLPELVEPGPRPEPPVVVPAELAPAAVAEPAPAPAAEPEPEPRTGAAGAAHVRVGHHLVAIDRVILVGRRPAAPRIPVPGGHRLLRVPSPNGEISSTHLELRPAGTGILVTDLRSTNGTLLRRAEGTRLVQGETVVVQPPASLELGEGAVLELIAPGEA